MKAYQMNGTKNHPLNLWTEEDAATCVSKIHRTGKSLWVRYQNQRYVLELVGNTVKWRCK